MIVSFDFSWSGWGFSPEPLYHVLVFFSSRMIDVQIKMTGRALELLCVPEDKPCYVLDIGWDPGAQFRQSRWGDVLGPHTVESLSDCLPAAVLAWAVITSQMRGTTGWALTSALPCWVSMPCLALVWTPFHEFRVVMQIVLIPNPLFSNVDEALDRETQGDVILGDMGQGIPFKPGTFDACIR